MQAGSRWHDGNHIAKSVHDGISLKRRSTSHYFVETRCQSKLVRAMIEHGCATRGLFRRHVPGGSHHIESPRKPSFRRLALADPKIKKLPKDPPGTDSMM